MKRNAKSVKGPGWSKAFQDAATQEYCGAFQDGNICRLPKYHDASMNSTAHDFSALNLTTQEIKPVCERSGDAGSLHIWPEGAQPGDWCLCGKRKKYPPVSEFGK